MNFKSHLTLSIVIVTLGLFYLWDKGFIVPEMLIFAPLLVFYGLIPDVDIKSKSRKIAIILLLIASILISIYSFFYDGRYYAMLSIPFVLSIIMLSLKHRGFTHSFFFGLIIVVPLTFISVYFVVLAYITFLGHLVLDL